MLSRFPRVVCGISWSADPAAELPRRRVRHQRVLRSSSPLSYRSCHTAPLVLMYQLSTSTLESLATDIVRKPSDARRTGPQAVEPPPPDGAGLSMYVGPTCLPA